MMELDFIKASCGVKEITMGPGSGPIGDPVLAPKIKSKTQKPALYNVIMLNDDYTPMNFVQEVLRRHFQKTNEAAYIIMMRVHREGAATAGTYTHEIAETKAQAVMDEAKAQEFPFMLTLEKA